MKATNRLAPLLLLVAPILVLAVEGAHSLWTGRPLFRRGGVLERTLIETMFLDDEERRAAALTTEGPYASSRDPWVGIEMKPDFAGAFLDAAYTTDALGMRRRLGPEPADDGLRILVLGDSVAFGFGVADDECLGHRLEVELAAARGVRTRPAVFTSATLGWTVANARCWLLDHFEEIRPDVVVHVVVGNDMDDSFCVLENGMRSVDHDPARGAELRPHVGLGYFVGMMAGLRFEDRISGLLDRTTVPEYALYSGVTPESLRRWSTMFSHLRDLQRRVRDRGGHYLVLTVDASSPFDRVFARRAVAEHPELPYNVLFARTEPTMRLEGDAHLNARALAEAARRLAVDLIERGIVEGDAELVSPSDTAFSDNAAELPSVEHARAELEDTSSAVFDDLGPRIDLESGLGFHQLYGGVWPDGVSGPRAWLVLKQANAKSLRIECAPLAEREFSAGRTLTVTVDGIQAGVIELPSGTRATEPTVRTISLPPSAQELREVVLTCDPWSMGRYRRVPRTEAYSLLRVELLR